MPSRPYPLEAAFRGIVSPFERFLRRTSAGGIVLLVATVLAFAAATIGGHDRYDALWMPKLAFNLLGGPGISLTLHGWINEGLMALFFLVVGLEIKREILVGELSSPREAFLPAIAALGGVAVPACIYAAFNRGTPALSGWAIPTATDIAFAVGVLVMLSSRVPRGAVVFLTALAIADDLFAVAAIGLFYAKQLNGVWIGAAAAVTLALVLCNRAGIRRTTPYVVLGVVLWYAVLNSGVHSTVAGLIVALAIPARSRATVPEVLVRLDELRTEFATAAEKRIGAVADALERAAVAVQSPLQRIEHRMTPWVAFGVVPLFALSNAGIDLRGLDWGGMLLHPVTAGVAVGLCVGKPIGILLAAWLSVRTGIARLPPGVTWRHMAGCGCLGGIGFTMSLFIGQLAFGDVLDVERARLGTVAGSLVAAICGWACLRAGARGTESRES